MKRNYVAVCFTFFVLFRASVVSTERKWRFNVNVNLCADDCRLVPLFHVHGARVRCRDSVVVITIARKQRRQRKWMEIITKKKRGMWRNVAVIKLSIEFTGHNGEWSINNERAGARVREGIIVFKQKKKEYITRAHRASISISICAPSQCLSLWLKSEIQFVTFFLFVLSPESPSLVPAFEKINSDTLTVSDAPSDALHTNLCIALIWNSMDCAVNMYVCTCVGFA